MKGPGHTDPSQAPRAGLAEVLPGRKEWVGRGYTEPPMVGARVHVFPGQAEGRECGYLGGRIWTGTGSQ